MSTHDVSFADRYGPWALVAGASEGVGEAYAHAMAERGLHVVLLARRQQALDEVAAAIQAKTGVETRAVAIDLSQPDAMTTIAAATRGLDVGMVMYCAGADATYEPFLANPVDVPLALVRRNCITPMEVCHRFAQPMVARRKGAIVLVSSGAGFAGGANMVGYCASKAFDMVMSEALWAELHTSGVDILSLILGVTDTPALRRLLTHRGVLASLDDPLPMPAAAPHQVVAEALEHLCDGPTWIVGEQNREHERTLRSMTRNDAVRAMLQGAPDVMGADQTAPDLPPDHGREQAKA